MLVKSRWVITSNVCFGVLCAVVAVGCVIEPAHPWIIACLPLVCVLVLCAGKAEREKSNNE